ncbi:MAG: hypothetical protein JRI54_00055 [Deltaproteobacteria bacterium]|nr:hypothetical protein [Deltaproteobacteria bacterium]
MKCILSTPANASEWRSGLSCSSKGLGIKLIEYINGDWGFFADSFITEDSNKELETVTTRIGVKIYLNKIKRGYFLNGSISSYESTTGEGPIDGFSLGCGYIYDLSDSWFANIETGFLYLGNNNSGFYLAGSCDLSWTSLFKNRRKKREEQLAKTGWSREIINAVMEHKIRVGMTMDQVLESWGNPDSKYTSGNYQIWQYETFYSYSGYYHSYTLYFTNGILNHWDEYESNN